MPIKPIIEIEELREIYPSEDVMLFDASGGKDAKATYENQHIEGAFFVDLEDHLADIKDDFSNGGRHPLPSPETFAKTLTDLGISKNKHVVIYDNKNGSNAAARFWWMLKSVGHRKVQVLNGGLEQAKKHLPLSSKTVIISKSTDPYPVTQWQLPLVTIDEVERLSTSPEHLLIDVRDRERYEGKTEPIDLVAGHIPNAINIPLTENLDSNGLFLSPAKLKKKYEDSFGGAKPENIVVHCGSGVTACHTLLALAHAGMELPKLYVGSWSEWSRNDKPIAKSDN